MNFTKKQEQLLSRAAYLLIFSFILTINLLRLPVADEWAQWPGRPTEGLGVSFIINTYFTWNSRIGEMIFRVFEWNAGGTIFEMQTIFGIVNTFVFCGMLANLFYLLRGSFPKANKKDALISLTLLACLMLCSHFDESFIWMSGAVNYGWALFLASCLALPYRRYWDSISTKSAAFFDSLKGYFSVKEILKALGFFIISIPAGMGGEIFTPPLCFGLFIFMLIVFFQKKQFPPLWFLAGGLGLFAGWLLLILAPGPALRKAILLELSSDTFDVSIPLVIRRFVERVRYPYSIYPLVFSSAYLLWLFKQTKKIHFGVITLIACGLFGIAASCAISFTPLRTMILHNIFFIIAFTAVLTAFFEQNQEFKAEWGVYLIFLLGFFLIRSSPLKPHAKPILYAAAAFFTVYSSIKVFPLFPFIVKTLIVPACLSIMAFYLIAYGSAYSFLKGNFKEIERQKKAGISHVIVPFQEKHWWSEYINILGLSAADWVLNPMALYYNVERIDFVDPITMKSYRGRFD